MSACYAGNHYRRLWGLQIWSSLSRRLPARNATVRIAGYAAAGVLADTKYGTVRGRGEIEQIREAVLLEALDLRIPLSRENITVEKEVNYVFISLNYVVPVILPWGEFNWNFEITVDN